RDEPTISSNLSTFGMASGTGLVASYSFNNGIANANNTGNASYEVLADITGNGHDGNLDSENDNQGTGFDFGTADVNLSNWIASTVSVSSGPEITVQDGSSNGIAFDGSDSPSPTNNTDFGFIGQHGNASRTYTIQNDGLANLAVTSIAVQSGEYTIANATETLPAVIAPMGNMTFDVVAGPTTLGTKAGAIRILSDDLNEGTYDFNVTAEVVENSLDFDGVDDKVIVASDPALNVQQFTLEAWIYINTLPAASSQNMIIQKGSGQGDRSGYMLLIAADIGSTMRLEGNHIATNGSVQQMAAEFPFSTSTWYHVASTFDDTDVRLYVNGNLIHTETVSSGGVDYDGSGVEDFKIGVEEGSTLGSYDNYFDGQIDEVRVWDYARSITEIQSAAGSTLSNESGLIASYDFNNGQAGAVNTAITTLVDLTSNGLNGDLDIEGDGVTSGFDFGTALVSSSNWVGSVAQAAASSDIAVHANGGAQPIDNADGALAADGTDFTNVSETRSVVQTFTISNDGVTPFDVTSITGSDADYTISDLNTSIGSDATFTATYLANGGDDITNVTINNNSTVNQPTDQTFVFGLAANPVPDLALDFDGGDDYVALARTTLASGLTYEAWIQTTSTSSANNYAGNPALAVIGDTDNNVRNAFGIHGGVVRYTHYDGSWNTFDGTIAVNDGNWHHIAVTHDQATGDIELFVDGNGDGNFNVTYDAISSFNRIGGSYLDGSLTGDLFEGSIDEVRIWNDVRTSTEISDNRTKSLTGQESGLQAYYQFDNTTVTGRADNSAVGTRNDVADKLGVNNGTANNFDMGLTNNASTGFRSHSNWVYSGALSPDISVNMTGEVYSDATNTVQFGGKGANDPALSRIFTVTNTGGANLNLSSLAVTNDGTYFTVSADFGSIMLTPGNSTTFTIDFIANSKGNRQETITFTTDDIDEGTYQFDVFGTGIIGPGDVTNGLVTWQRGEDAIVGNWNDFSGNSEHFSQGVAINRPAVGTLGYQEAVTFDGTNHFMNSSNSGILGGGAYTKILVMQHTGGSVGQILSSDAAAGHELKISATGQISSTHDNTDQVTTGTGFSDQVLVVTSESDAALSAEIYVNGNSEGTNSANGAYTDATVTQLGAFNSTPLFTGTIAEFVLYNRVLTPGERARVEGYLAAKYGSGYTANVVASDGTDIWTSGGGYDNGIAAVGRDDNSSLHVKQNYNLNDDRLFAVGVESIAANNNSNLTLVLTGGSDLTFLAWGHDGGVATATTDGTLPDGITERLDRTWLISEKVNNTPTDFVTDLDIDIEMQESDGYGTTADDFVLLVDPNGDGDWSDATVYGATSYNAGTDVVSFQGVDLDHGNTVTIGHGLDMALDFDGTDDYVSIADNVLLEPAGAFTIEFWMQTSVTANQIILEKGS
ncbi:LamG-like jellyroll fold domain-containing protein, partial [Reichenbachiella sp.]